MWKVTITLEGNILVTEKTNDASDLMGIFKRLLSDFQGVPPVSIHFDRCI